MSTAVIDQRRDAGDSVRAWRLEQLSAAGYPRRDAKVLSERSDIDLHLAIRLVSRGCPVETALQILL